MTEPNLSQFEQQKNNVIRQLVECDANEVENYADIIAQSDFLLDSFRQFPNWLTQIAQNPPDFQELNHYSIWLNQKLEHVFDESSLLKTLRHFRRWILVRIAWSQLTNCCSTEQSLKQLSVLAEQLIITTRDWLYQQSSAELGTPCDSDGNPQPLLILGMGKLGGGELNFSSDIDLIFTYPKHGVTVGARREYDNSVFFTRLGQRIIKSLDLITEDGFVYRVDMRLRPLGDGGPLVLSFAAMEDYYQEQGRDWERYAMIKAKVLGDHNNLYTQELYRMLRPFVYRRYIDFSVLQSLRNMKSMIAREVRRRGLEQNIKLGAGGIREIEFIVQVFQLIRGGRLIGLQTRSLLCALSEIEKQTLLSKQEVDCLRENYLFLRRTENLLQAINDEQTQTLPSDELNQIRLALGMGFNNWQTFHQNLLSRMQTIRQIFDSLIGQELPSDAELGTHDNGSYHTDLFAELWTIDLEPSDVKAVLGNCTQEEAEQISKMLLSFQQDISKRTIGVRGREILDRLMPRLLKAIFDVPSSVTVLQRILSLLINIISRTTYLELLFEYPNALKQLIRLCALSPMISEQLAHYPILLDELIDINSLYQTTALQDYKSELYQYLLRISADDEELQLEALRQFKQMQLLHIAAADVEQMLPTMKISDHLTFVAEALIDFVMQMAWNQMTQRYGLPDHLADGEKGIVVVAYGKLGGFELGYGSDLDLVFLHNAPETSMTTGSKVIDSRQFYLRLVQRIIHLFNVRTGLGVLYDIDVRLRPQGEAGLLACSLDAFNDYQMNDAWTWEHQALVRARCVYGETELIKKFNDIRHRVLSQIRDEATLKKAVREMREKMRAHLGSRSSDLFDIKMDEGGIGDIEFLSQFIVLNYAHNQPKMTCWNDNIRILALAAKEQILSHQEAQQLSDAYINMRNEIHRLALEQLPSCVEHSKFSDERQLVKRSWDKWLS